MFFGDLPKALREICRVLKPGGRAVLLAWGAMEQPYFATTIGAILRTLPELQLPASGANMFKFGVPGVLPAAMRAAGFAAVEESFTQVPWNWPGTPEELWEYFREVTIPFKPLFETIPPGRREEVDAAVLHALHERFRDSQVEFEAEIVIVSAAAN